MQSRTLVLAAAAAGACVLLYVLRQRQARLPTAEEQAWLDEQMRTPKPSVTSPSGQVSAEEQKWMDKQIDDAEDADVRTPFHSRHASSPRPSSLPRAMCRTDAR
jgi:hypothetical protein